MSGSQNYLPRVSRNTSSYAVVGRRRCSGAQASAGIRSTPDAVAKRKEKPPGANAAPVAELLRSVSILGWRRPAERPGWSEVTHTLRTAKRLQRMMDGLTDTPGSVLPCRYQRGSSGHPSTDAVADALQRPTRTLGRAALKRVLSGLAPGGVYLAFPVTREAGGLLHHRFTLTCFVPLSNRRDAGGLFSVALACGLPRVGVTHHPALRSPDVPRATCVTRGRLVNPSAVQSTVGKGRHRRR